MRHASPPHRLPRRRFLSTLALAALALPAAVFVSGCPNNNAGGGSTTTATGGTTSGAPSSSPVPAGGVVKAGLVTDVGGVADRSFNQLAWEGMQKAKADLGADIKFSESKQNGEYVSNLTRFAQSGYGVVFAVGFLMEDALKQVAPKFPNVKFAIIDGNAPDLPNCVSYKFREEQGSFLAGALAGAMTKTNTLGFVGGVDSPLIKKFEVGYKAGAMSTNPKVKVLVGYAGKFDDPEKGQALANSQLGSKADIIYHAAGSTGIGVIRAVQNRGAGFYAIGVDKDQDGDAPGRVLTSMVKSVDVAVFDVCKAVADGTFKPGTVTLGLEENGVGLSAMKFTKKDVPAPVMAKIDDLRGQIIAGTIKPPTTEAELAAFKPFVESIE